MILYKIRITSPKQCNPFRLNNNINIERQCKELIKCYPMRCNPLGPLDQLLFIHTLHGSEKAFFVRIAIDILSRTIMDILSVVIACKFGGGFGTFIFNPEN